MLKMLELIESTRIETLPRSWTERVSRRIDYHPGRAGPGGDYFYFDLFERHKIGEPLLVCVQPQRTRVR